MLNGRPLLTIKDPGSPEERFKERLAMPGPRGLAKETLVSEAPAVPRHFVKATLALAASRKFLIWAKDAKQACEVRFRPTPRRLSRATKGSQHPKEQDS